MNVAECDCSLLSSLPLLSTLCCDLTPVPLLATYCTRGPSVGRIQRMVGPLAMAMAPTQQRPSHLRSRTG